MHKIHIGSSFEMQSIELPPEISGFNRSRVKPRNMHFSSYSFDAGSQWTYVEHHCNIHLLNK